MCRKDSETDHGRALASAGCVAPSWTPNLNMEKSAAPPKPLEDTMLVFTLSSADSHLRTWASPRIPENSQKHNPGRLISLAPLLSQDAGRLQVCVCPPPTQQRLEETPCRQPLIVNCHNACRKFLIFVAKASFVVPSGPQMGDRTLPPLEPCSVQETLRPAATANKCRQNISNTE